MLILLRTLHRVLHDDTVSVVVADANSSNDESCIAFAPRLHKLLPLFRLYLAWSYVTRADLLQYHEYLEPHIKELYRLLAEVLTSLNRYVDPTMETVSSKYLLTEDAEAQGLRPFNDRKLPLFLHVEEQQGSTPPKRVKTRKPQQYVFGRRFKQETEAVWRIRDIICCGVFLAGSAKFPIALTTQTSHGRDIEAWVFVDGATTPCLSDEAGMSRLLSKLKSGDARSGPENITEQNITEQNTIEQGATEQATNKPRTQSSRDSSIPTPENAPKASISQLQSTSNKKKAKSEYPIKPSTNYQDSDLCEDTEMINMVNKLLDPADDVRPQSSLTHTEPSYGMHSSTANEIFGNLQSNSIQPSSTSKAIPSLPWDYFYQPTPHRSNSRDQNQLSSNGHNVPRSATGQMNGFGSSYLDDLNAPYHQASPSPLSPLLNMGYPQKSPIPSASSPSLSRKDYGLDTLEYSRSAVLDSLRSALLAEHGFTQSSEAPASNNLQNRTSITPVWGQQSATAEPSFPQTDGPSQSQGYWQNNANTYLEPSVKRQANVSKLPNPLGPPGQGRPELGRATPTTGPGRSPVAFNSTNNKFDVQHIWNQGSSSDRQDLSPWNYEPATTSSSLAFSRPSSLIMGTPGAASAAPTNTVACNGHYYNASTPFGRLGDSVNNRADPTHFRNQLKAAIGTSELAYDQQILQGAMMDNNRKPRPK